MSYNKTIWKSGDIITTEKWNNLTNNVPGFKMMQIPFEWMEEEESNSLNEEIIETKVSSLEPINVVPNAKLLITSEQLNNYIKNGYLCYYVLNNYFYYFDSNGEGEYIFSNTSWVDNGNGYLEAYIETHTDVK